MKILSAKQIKVADEYTISNEPIASIDLMERAVQVFVNKISVNLKLSNDIAVFCGPGNNGGDGLGIARILHTKNFNVKVFLVEAEKYSIDNLVNQERLKEVGFKINFISDEKDFSDLQPNTVIIDALFGSGLSKPLEGIYAKLVNFLNNQPITKYAVDIPSGLIADAPSFQPIIKADYTYTFQTPKLAFLLPENQESIGNWSVLDIQLHPEILENLNSENHIIDSHLIKDLLKNRARFSHKGTYGHTLVVAGSKGKMGAAILTSKAAIKAGAGLVSAFIPNCGYSIMQTAVPEVMCHIDQREEFISSKPENLNEYTTIALGPGIGTHQETCTLLEILIKRFQKPMVLDADALNIISENKNLLSILPPKSILTPHPKEFERLVGKSNNGFERLEKLKNFCKKYKLIVVLKDAYTAICNEEGLTYFNITGNPGMATGGSGDVLTGIIAGLVSQKYEPFNAAIIGCFIHGTAGDIALYNESVESLIASNIIENIGNAFNKIRTP
jgi:ADP-dependent NAD(P)H-hydrate dehydratase / NAD(P)H-hydrate epimerase